MQAEPRAKTPKALGDGSDKFGRAERSCCSSSLVFAQTVRLPPHESTCMSPCCKMLVFHSRSHSHRPTGWGFVEKTSTKTFTVSPCCSTTKKGLSIYLHLSYLYIATENSLSTVSVHDVDLKYLSTGLSRHRKTQKI